MFVSRCASVAFGWLVAGTLGALAQDVARVEVGMGFVEDKAREAASKPFVRPRDERPLPEALTKLDYNAYRRIQFRRDQAPWKDENLNFHIHFFFPGYSYVDTVLLNEF